MVENQRKFYLYDRWFEYQYRTGDKLVYISIPNNESSHMKIEMNQKTNEMTLLYLNGKKVIQRIEISDITEPTIELHYIQEVCNNIEIEEHEYDNLGIELFTTINNGGISHNLQIKFVKKNKNSNFAWVAPPFPLNEKIDMSDMDSESKIVAEFMDFVGVFSIHVRKLRTMILLQPEQENNKDFISTKEIVIPQELEVYDRVYHLNNIESNKIIFRNNQDGVRNLEIKYDPKSLSLLSVKLRIKDSNFGKGIIQIAPNKSHGVTARYCSKKKVEMKLGEKNLQKAKIHSNMVFDSNSKKVETSILISSNKKQVELLEHPYIKNNYTDGSGNLYVMGNSEYSIFYGIAVYAPGIFRSIEKKLFKTKVLKSEKNNAE